MSRFETQPTTYYGVCQCSPPRCVMDFSFSTHVGDGWMHGWTGRVFLVGDMFQNTEYNSIDRYDIHAT